MLVLLDNNAPRGLVRALVGHTVTEARERGWAELRMVFIDPMRVEIECEDDGRILASIPDFPGVMAYGVSEGEAVRKVKAIALQVLADMIESGEEVPG